MFIINTPFTFKAMWTIMKAFFDEKTSNKISLEGSSYSKKLLELVKFISYFRLTKKIFLLCLEDHAIVVLLKEDVFILILDLGIQKELVIGKNF